MNRLGLLIILIALANCSRTTTERGNDEIDILADTSEINGKLDPPSLEEQSIKRILGGVIDDSLIYGEFKTLSLEHLFTTKENSMDGVIGDDFRRLRVHISEAKKSSADSMLYLVTGKTKVNSNICDFKGSLRIESVIKYVEQAPEEPPYEVMGHLGGTFEFSEDQRQSGSGILSGRFSIKWNIYNESQVDFGNIWYTYRSSVIDYEGNWTEYKTKNSKRVCWSDYISNCLPEDFNCSDGPDIIPCDKYARNGWESLKAMFDYSNESARKKALETEVQKWWK